MPSEQGVFTGARRGHQQGTADAGWQRARVWAQDGLHVAEHAEEAEQQDEDARDGAAEREGLDHRARLVQERPVREYGVKEGVAPAWMTREETV